jgi:hypothetical protein
MGKLIVLVYLLSGCSSWMYMRNKEGAILHHCSLPIMVATSSNLEPEYHYLVPEAISFWNEALGQKVFQDMGVQDGTPDSLAELMSIGIGYADNWTATERTVAKFYPKAQPSSGCIRGGYVALIRVSDIKPEQRKLMMIHELGHVLGLDDTGIRNTIMSGNLDNNHASELTSEEKAALRLYY